MKKQVLLLSFCLCLLAGCASNHSAPSEPEPDHDSTQPVTVTMTCRIIAAERNELLLAKQDGDSGDVYTVPLETTVFTVDGKAIDLREPGASMDLPNQTLDGALAVISYDGSIKESFPAQFSQGTSVDILTSGFDDRCCLYIKVLEDLWKVDPALNDNISYLGLDLTETSLSPAEQSAIAWHLSAQYDVEPVQGTFEELVENGYITGEPLGTEDAPSDAKFWHWEDGCFFSITEQTMEGIYSLVPVTFDAQKWRSSLGAYWFCDCTAVQSALGKWSGYQIGSEMIS